MIEHVGRPLDFSCLYVKSGQAETGLSVTVDGYRITTSTGASTQIVTAGSASEVGSGIYRYQMSSTLNTVEGVYVASFYTASQVDQHRQLDRWYVQKAGTEYLDATVSSRVTAGAGAVSWTATVTDGTNPIDGVEVWITTDSAGLNVVAGTLSTNANGQATFTLDGGSYYLWLQRGGYTFSNPTAITVS